MSVIRCYALHLAWMISLVAVSGSLYMSEVLFWEPCKLCWSQRIFMYPLVLMLGIAAYRNDRGIVHYTLPLAIIGGAVSTYHYLLQKVQGVASLTPCRAGVPCNYNYMEGWITIPLLAFTAFLLIMILLIIARKDEIRDR